MNVVRVRAFRQNDRDLERVVEPLAGYICAADRPQAALRAAIDLLANEARETNRAAKVRVAVLLERQSMSPA